MTHTNLISNGHLRFPELQIVRSPDAGVRRKIIFGQNTNFSGTFETLTAGGGYDALGFAQTHNIVSTSADDDATTGQGVKTILIEGIDTNGDEISETLSMDGTVNVVTANAYFWINTITAVTWGTNISNQGIITATAVTDATVTIEMAPFARITQSSTYKIPRGHVGYIYDLNYGLNAPSAAFTVELRCRTSVPGSRWQILNKCSMESGAGRFQNVRTQFPFVVPSNQWVSARAFSATAASSAYVQYTLVLVQETE